MGVKANREFVERLAANLPAEALSRKELDGMGGDGLEIVMVMLGLFDGGGDEMVLSFIIEYEGWCYGLHCDYDSCEWSVVVDGEDWAEVSFKHQMWLTDEIEEKTGVRLD